MQVSILKTRKLIWEGNVKSVSLPTPEGEMCVLDFHQAFLVRLKNGEIRLSKPNFHTSIKDGIAFMQSNTLKILIESREGKP
ncbi:MAG: hypothetical protein ABIG56_03765 [Candidatus Omnitrophota bacterium]